ncbi:MAG TPA: capsule assembly Wzi family protein, partial [Puia sp.]|nr:capsule assembly Wzi family protein [Puia sp.]
MRNRWTILVLLFSCSRCWGQADNWHGSLEAQAVFISDRNNVPFWMRSDRFGSVPLPGTSASFLAAGAKEYSPQAGLVDWGASVLLRADVGSSSRVTLIEGFVKARFSIFQFRAGRIREFTGLVDSTLSSGAFAISGNALGIPKVQLSIPEYWSPPVFGNLFAFKGNFDYGWLGEDSIQYTRYTERSKLYYHQLSFWGRLGKPGWRLQLYGGFTHQVQWGDERSIYGPKFLLTPFKTFQYAVMGKTYLGSKIGNHIGSIDLAMSYDLGNVTVSLYRQNFYDEGALAKLANIADGLNGISLTNKEYRIAEAVPDYYPVLGDLNPPFQWHKVVFELFYSKNQAGYPWSKPTNSGDENYYNNFEYYQGWSYKG